MKPCEATTYMTYRRPDDELSPRIVARYDSHELVGATIQQRCEGIIFVRAEDLGWLIKCLQSIRPELEKETT